MKKIISILLVCLMLLGYTSVFAENMIVITQKPITVTYNGDGIHFPDAHPIIQNGRTLVPARAIMERAKLTVDFDSATKTVTAMRDNLVITMTIDQASATVTKGEEVQTITLEEPARIIDDRTYVPIRFIGESMALKVNWNANYREVVLIDTAEWWQEIAENAKMLDYVLSTPLANQDAYAGNNSGIIDLSLIFKNMPAEANIPTSLTLKFNFTITGAEVYDGTNNGSYTLLEADLSALSTLYKYLGADTEELSNWAKMHKIDFDIIVDADWNLYVKSAWLTDVIKRSGNPVLANAIGNNYIKLSLSEMLGMTPAELSSCETLRDMIEGTIVSDDMLYSQSVKMLDDMVALYIEMYHNDAVKVTEQYDGSERWSLTLDQNNISDLMLDMTQISAESTGMPLSDTQLKEQKEIYENMTFKTVVSLTIKDEKPVKSEVLYSLDTGDLKIYEVEGSNTGKIPTLRTICKINIGSSVRKFNSHTDQKITIPKNVITPEEAEQATITKS